MIFRIRNKTQQEEVINKITSLDLSKKWKVEIKHLKEKRSIDQNSLYWLWLACIEQETGNLKEDIHEHFKRKYLGWENVNIFGQNMNKSITTTKLDTSQFKNYLDKVQVFANSELGIELPNPDDLKFEQFKEYYNKFL